MERDEIRSRRLEKLHRVEADLLGQVAEVKAEIQRLEYGYPSQDLTPVLRPVDRFWQRKVNFDQTRAEQADMQSDAKESAGPRYDLLLQ